jgi:hypothetical protein
MFKAGDLVRLKTAKEFIEDGRMGNEYGAGFDTTNPHQYYINQTMLQGWAGKNIKLTGVINHQVFFDGSQPWSWDQSMFEYAKSKYPTNRGTYVKSG